MIADDLLVLGAGPAGLASAITGALAGMRVRVLDLPPARTSLVPESVHPGIETLLDTLGVKSHFLEVGFQRFAGICVDGIRSPFGQDANGPWMGFHVRRSQFDQILRQRAESLGVGFIRVQDSLRCIRDDVRFRGVSMGQREYFAAWTIDATGRSRFLGRQFGLKERKLSERRMAWRGTNLSPVWSPDRDPSYAYLDSDSKGWLWTVASSDGTCAWTRVSVVLDKPLQSVEHHEAGFPMEAFDVRWRLFRPCVGSGWVLAGDAAATLDPAAGNGVFFALQSGIRAVDAVLRVKRSSVPEALVLAGYDGWLVDSVLSKADRLRAWYPPSY